MKKQRIVFHDMKKCDNWLQLEKSNRILCFPSKEFEEILLLILVFIETTLYLKKGSKDTLPFF